jgi:uncharacterized protein YyaL (SSP411 family)
MGGRTTACVFPTFIFPIRLARTKPLTSTEQQISLFYDHRPLGTGAFFSTPSPHLAPDIILRLKEGMDASEPSTNGISASNLYRLGSFFNSPHYENLAKETVTSFESEMLQYPWLFASFMPSLVAGRLGAKGVVVSSGEAVEIGKIKEFEKQPRGALGSFVKLGSGDSWLRGRNSLLKDFGKDGKGVRVMICENGACKEENINGGIGLGNLRDVTNALPVTSTTEKAEEKVVLPVVGKENTKSE